MGKHFIYIVFSLIFLASCKDTISESSDDDPILASVFDKNLYFSNISPLIQTEASTEDSIMYSNALVEKWVRETILLHEAEKNIPADLDIKKMVDDYRASLILLNYKQKLVHERLDTVITQEQLEDYYAQYNQQYKLNEAIIKCTFYKVKIDSRMAKKIDDLWNKQKYNDLAEIDDAEFELKLIQEEQWLEWKNVNALFPNSFWTYAELKSKKPVSKSGTSFKYYIKVSQSIDENQIAPLSYIEDQVKKVILYKRQTELLNNVTEDLYAKYSKNNNVKINI